MKIKVLQVCDKLGIDGSTIHGVSRLFSWWFPKFDQAQLDVCLVSLKGPDAAGRYLEGLGIPVVYLNKSKFSPLTLPALLSVVRSFDPDVLHLHGYAAGTFGRIAAVMSGVPAIVHEHFVDPNIPKYQIPTEALLAPLSKHTITNCEAVREFCISQRKLNPKKISIIYNGIPVENFRCATDEQRQTVKKQLRIPPDRKIVGTIARLHPQKGIEYFIRAMPKILSSHPNTQFLIVGDGNLRSELEALVQHLDVADNVIFTGYVSDIRPVLSILDIKVISSIYEGTTLTVFEAMALHVPIVSTNADGLKEVLTDQYTALLVPPGDLDALADRISFLLANEELRETLRRNCENEKNRFDVMSTVTQMRSVYEQIIDGSVA